MILVLLACEPVDTGPKYEPVTDWRGSKYDVLVAKAPRYTVESAVAAARVEEVEPSESDPDLSGSWIAVEVNGKSVVETRTLRQRVQPGVYNTIDTVYGYQEGSAVVQFEITAIEVVDREQLCRYTIKTRTSYAKEYLAPELKDLRVSLSPDALNEVPCISLVQLTSELVELGEVGHSVQQTRRPKPVRR